MRRVSGSDLIHESKSKIINRCPKIIMVREVKLKTSQNSIQFINKVWTNNPYWSIKNMGEVKSIPNSTHYHIRSKNPDHTGTVELTLNPRTLDRVRLKVAKNRKGNWANKAKNEILKYI